MKTMSKDPQTLFAGVTWACDQSTLGSFFAELDTFFQAGVKGDTSRATKASTVELDASGTLKASIKGMMLSKVPAWFAWFDIDATDTTQLAKDLEAQLGNPDVKAVELAVNSGGGDVSGVQRLGDVIAKFKVPTVAKVEGIVASAAYWVASQADKIEANDINDVVGSIGVCMVMTDTSRLDKNVGIERHLVRSGPNKAVGADGKVSTENVKTMQAHVDAVFDSFKAAITKGRGLEGESLDAVSDGRIFTASQAIELGLIDNITSVQASEPSRNNSPTPMVVFGATEESMAIDEKALAEFEAKLAAKFEGALTTLSGKLDAVEKENMNLKKELEAKASSFKSLEAAQKSALIDGAIKAGKVLPAMRPMVEAFATSASAEELGKHLAGMPVVLHSEPTGNEGGQDGKQVALASDEARIARMFGLTDAEYAQAGSVASVSLLKGTLNLKDGTSKKFREVK